MSAIDVSTAPKALRDALQYANEHPEKTSWEIAWLLGKDGGYDEAERIRDFVDKNRSNK